MMEIFWVEFFRTYFWYEYDEILKGKKFVNVPCSSICLKNETEISNLIFWTNSLYTISDQNKTLQEVNKRRNENFIHWLADCAFQVRAD